MKDYLKKIKPKHYKWLAFFLTVITYLMAFSYQGLLSNGKYIIARSDLLQQYIPFIHMLGEAIHGEKSLWYSWNLNMGGSTALLNAYYTLSPFNLLFFIFGKSYIMEACALVIVLKAGLAAFTFQIFAQRVLRQGIETVLFAIMYALCGFQVSYYFILSWMDALYMFPVLILLICRLIKEGKWLPLVPAYGYLFFTNFYMGYMAGICSFFLFAAYILYTYKNKPVRVYIKTCVKYFTSVLWAAGLTCVIWYPAVRELLFNLSDYAGSFESTYCNPLFIYNNLFVGQMQTLQGVTPFVYSGLPVLLLLPYYFLNRHIRLRERLYAALLIIWFVVCMLVLPLNMLMHAFDDPNMLRYRYAYCLSFLLVVIGCRQFRYLRIMAGKWLVGILLVNVLVYLASAFMYDKIYINDYSSNTPAGFAVNAVFILGWVAAAWAYRRRRTDSITFYTLAGLLIMTELAVNAGMCLSRMEHKAMLKDAYTAWYGLTETAVEKIKENDQGWYRINARHMLNRNTGIWFDFQSLTNFTSAGNRTLMHTMKDLGFYVDDVIMSHAGGTPATELILGIKYEMDMAKDLANIGDSGSWKNALNYEKKEQYLGLGYMAAEEILTYKPETSPFMNQNRLLTALTGETITCFENEGQVSLKIENGKFEKENGISYLIKTEKEEEAVFHFTLPVKPEREAFAYFRQPQSKYPAGITELKTNEAINENITVDFQLYPERIIKLGEHAGSYGLDVILKENTDRIAFYDAYFAYFNDSELQRAYEVLRQNQWKDVTLSKRGAKGVVEVDGEKSILFTTIPYIPGFKALVDGKPAGILPLLDEAFIGIRLKPGVHTVEFTYRPPALRTGAVVSGTALLLLLIVYSQKRIWRVKPLSNKKIKELGDVNMKRERKELGNKGFSLVELIVVIAIMAILVGVLAPSLIRYVEKTNVSADTQLADAVKTAVLTAMMDPSVLNSTDSSSQNFISAHSGTFAGLDASCGGAFAKSVAETLGISGTDGAVIQTELVKKLKSAHGASAAINVQVKSNNSVAVEITQTDADGGKDTSGSTNIKVE